MLSSVTQQMKVVRGNEIKISPTKWRRLNKSHSKEEIKKIISDAIEENDLPLPMRKIKKRDALEGFRKLLSLNTSEVVTNESWFTRYDYKYPLGDILFGCSTVGNKASDYYQQSNRWLCDSINAPSPYRTWTTERFKLTLLNALWTLKCTEVNSKVLRTCIGLRKYIASQFRPSTAKAIYDHFGAKDVLDFSSGWGDRLCGFLASNARSYVGIDPNERLFPQYDKMIEDLGAGDKKIKLINKCAENTTLGRRKFDLVFTSPPYFNIERYTQEDNQSFKKYRKIENWLESFLFKAIDLSWKHLRPDGCLVINVSDVYSNHTINKICDPMNDYIKSLKGAEYVGCYGYQMRTRPNSGALKGKTGKFAEPMWIWKKRNFSPNSK
tara:strand:+ start:518 stop:1660 length:1143 start_codon:yes stop_codon:yes gene_type:complete